MRKKNEAMAFGITRTELSVWKERVKRGELAYLTHYWLDDRFPGIKTVTKVGCSDLQRLTEWCAAHGLNPKYIHHRPPFPHFDLMGPKQQQILAEAGLHDHLERFNLL